MAFEKLSIFTNETKYIKYKNIYSTLKTDSLNNIQLASRTRKFLIIIPAGDNSLHIEADPYGWFFNNRNYDLYVNYYGENDNIAEEYKAKSDYFSRHKGPKWSIIRAVLFQTGNFWEKYDYIWFPDDDLRLPNGAISINELFNIAANFKLNLSQPALIDENVSHKNLIYNPNSLLRFTNFVEIMCPLFSITAFKTIISTLKNIEIKSGWGLDYIWPQLLNYKSIAVIDAIPIHHTRVASFTNKVPNSFYIKFKINPIAEMNRSFLLYNCEKFIHRSFFFIKIELYNFINNNNDILIIHIYNRKPVIIFNKGALQNRHNITIKMFEHLYNILSDKLPDDKTYVIYTGDTTVRLNTLIPVLTYSTNIAAPKTIPFPDFNFENLTIAKYQYPFYDYYTQMKTVFENNYNFDNRKSKLFFCSIVTNTICKHFTEQYRNNPLIDIIINNNPDRIIDHSTYKYVLDLPCNGYSRCLKYLFLLGSVVFIVQRKDTEYWFNNFIPWVDYVPVSVDGRDLLTVLKKVDADSDLARSIAKSGTKKALDIFSEDRIYKDFAKILTNY